MRVTLTEDLAKFVRERIRSGGYSGPSEVVREALRELRAREDPAETDSRELAELLRPAVCSSHRSLTKKDFEHLRQRARRGPGRR